MNRERAETFLRLLAETGLRSLQPPPPLHAGGATDAPFFPVPPSLTRAAWALAAAGALDDAAADDILADVELALAVRQQHLPADPARGKLAGADWLSRLTAVHQRRWRFARPWRSPGPPRGIPARAAGPGSAGPGRGLLQDPAAHQAALHRYVPVGLFIPFDDEAVSGELGLLSFVHTASGAWLTATWRTRDPLGRWVRWHHDVPPVEKFTVIDDRGLRYQLGFRTSGRPNSACALSLHPDPPEGIGWLGITAPGGAAVRVSLERQDPGAGPAVTVSQTGQEAGEQMLNQLAERLLVMVPDCPQYLHLEPGAAWPGPLTDRAAGLGGIVAALEAAEILPPLSPVPGQLAALCARLRIDGHGIHAAPAHDLPEPWLSLLSHYHRRKPDPPARDGSAPLAAALPELDGIRLVLLGLHNADGTTWMHALAIGQIPDHPHARLGLDATFPLSVWIRDSAGRWHAACTRTWHNDDGQRMLTLRLVPPLARGADWIEVAAAGRSAEARARLPLCWGYPP